MARADAYRTTVESPVKKYLSWSSNDKCFNFYDKETKENKKASSKAFHRRVEDHQEKSQLLRMVSEMQDSAKRMEAKYE